MSDEYVYGICVTPTIGADAGTILGELEAITPEDLADLKLRCRNASAGDLDCLMITEAETGTIHFMGKPVLVNSIISIRKEEKVVDD
jgi:hypothetical protein